MKPIFISVEGNAKICVLLEGSLVKIDFLVFGDAVRLTRDQTFNLIGALYASLDILETNIENGE